MSFAISKVAMKFVLLGYAFRVQETRQPRPGQLGDGALLILSCDINRNGAGQCHAMHGYGLSRLSAALAPSWSGVFMPPVQTLRLLESSSSTPERNATA